jgi:non-heme chloroperoxidase
MTIQVVLVHGIRTSASMWRVQLAHLAERGVDAVAIDLPGHGTRMAETFTLDGAFETVDQAVQAAATRGPVLLVGHSMGGLLSTAYTGREDRPPVDAFVAASCTAIPRGVGLAAYRTLARGFDRLPRRGQPVTDWVLARTLPEETRSDFGAGGYAYDAQDVALKSLSVLDLLAALRRIDVPTWFINGQFDQLRVNERLFASLVPGAELIVVPRTSHLVTAMRPRVFNALLDVAVGTLRSRT